MVRRNMRLLNSVSPYLVATEEEGRWMTVLTGLCHSKVHSYHQLRWSYRRKLVKHHAE